jgi:mannosyltransferase OCH1-like enzyme
MRTDAHYAKYSGRYPQEWKRIKDLYDQFQRKKLRAHLTKAKCRIPKKIHLIWLGSRPSEFVQNMVESWKKLHPTWEVRLWTDEDVLKFHLKNQDAYNRAKNWGEKSDIFRYEILEREGGIHADTDFECIRPFDDLCKVADFFAGVGYSEGAPFLYNGLIGCTPHHPIIKRCVDTLSKGNGDSNFLRILNTTGPTFFTKCFRECTWPTDGSAPSAELGTVVAFPLTFFYPFPDVRRESYPNTEAIKRDWIHPETYAIHYWKISWLN